MYNQVLYNKTLKLNEIFLTENIYAKRSKCWYDEKGQI